MELIKRFVVLGNRRY